MATTIKSKAVNWLALNFGVKNKFTYASRFYVPGKSWTGHSAWWLEIPRWVIEAPTSTVVHLLCEATPDASDFYHLEVPAEFIRKQLSNLAMRKNNRVSLFLSAESVDLFIDQRGKGKVNFSGFQKLDSCSTVGA
jgi:hypothetical protein